jgi:hypothetical protein
MSEYIIANSMIYADNELCHYGKKGMKWGVITARKNHADRKISRLQNRNVKLEKRAAKYDVKAGKRALRNIKRGVPEAGLVPTKKSAKLNVKAAKLEKKALKLDKGDRKYLKVKRKAAKARLKSTKAMTISELSTKKDYKYQINAAKARYKIESNKLKIHSLNAKSVELGRQLMAADDTQ